MRVLITGAHGKLGKEVSKLYPGAWRPTHEEMPVERIDLVIKYIESVKPDILIHLAAMVSPPRCEVNKALAWDINVNGTSNLIDSCLTHKKDTYFILMSTPCVFNGDDEEPKDEKHYPDADNFYGFTKACQELLVQNSGLDYLIVRGNFVPREPWPYPKAFTDRKSNYLFADQLARGIKDIIDVRDIGIRHVLGNKILSMWDLAQMCPNSKDVGPITLEEYHGDCKLTRNMVLESHCWRKYDIGG